MSFRHRTPAALLAAALASCAAARGTDAAAARFELFVLGVAQDGGVPHLGCERECCAAARREGRAIHQTSLGVHDRETGALLLIEATPAIEPQIALLHELAGARGRGRRPVDAVLLTHAHVGHYLGLAQLGREVASTSRLPVHVTPRFAAFLREHGPWSQLVELGEIELHEHVPGEPFAPIEGLEVIGVQVPHRDELSDTVALLLRGPAGSALFLPDVDRWDVAFERVAPLIEASDVVYLDGTFYDGSELPDRDLEEIPHPPMVDTLARLATRARERPGSVRFVHLNHTNPALFDGEIRRDLERRGFRVAEPGERVWL